MTIVVNERKRVYTGADHMPGTEVITEHEISITHIIPTNKEVSCFKSLRCCIYHANKC